MKIAVGYARVSTERQANEGVSLEAQRARIEAWCAAGDYQLAGVHVDEGLSGGRSDNRPALKSALDQVCGNKGAALVVYSLSRLARSTRDTIDIAERLERAGANLVSLSENVDTTSAAGLMFFRLMAVIAEWERDIIRERTRAALRHKRALGQRVGSIPYGYELGADGATLVPLAEEIATIERIKALRASGQSYRSIASQLEEEGVSAKCGRRWHSKVVMELCKRGVSQPES